MIVCGVATRHGTLAPVRPWAPPAGTAKGVDLEVDPSPRGSTRGLLATALHPRANANSAESSENKADGRWLWRHVNRSGIRWNSDDCEQDERLGDAMHWDVLRVIVRWRPNGGASTKRPRQSRQGP